MIVVDASVLAHLLIEGPDTAAARATLLRDPAWAAPPLLRSEMTSVFLQYLRVGQVNREDAAAALAEAANTIGGRVFVPEPGRVLDLALRSGCSAYDCEYVAVAEALGVPLVTADRQVLSAFRGTALTPAAFAA